MANRLLTEAQGKLDKALTPVMAVAGEAVTMIGIAEDRAWSEAQKSA